MATAEQSQPFDLDAAVQEAIATMDTPDPYVIAQHLYDHVIPSNAYGEVIMGAAPDRRRSRSTRSK